MKRCVKAKAVSKWINRTKIILYPVIAEEIGREPNDLWEQNLGYLHATIFVKWMKWRQSNFFLIYQPFTFI